jgi:hypothetical protein
MSSQQLPYGAPVFARLRELARRRPPAERCDLCGQEVAEHHDHLMEPAARRLVCACGACAVLFSGQSGTRYKRVPRRIRLLTDFALTDSQWDDLRLPINLAFFFFSTPQSRMIAAYPSPAGATESLLPLEAWVDIQTANPVLAEMEPDVETLLVNRVGSSRGLASADYFLAPIDQCYRLVGLIRTGWKGLSGGADVWRDIARFFGDLKRLARGPGERDA